MSLLHASPPGRTRATNNEGKTEMSEQEIREELAAAQLRAEDLGKLHQQAQHDVAALELKLYQLQGRESA